MKGWEKTHHSHGLCKQAGVSILISDKVNFKTKLVRRDKEGHFILLKGIIHQQGITIINIYAPKQWSIGVHQTNTSQFQESNRPQHNNTG